MPSARMSSALSLAVIVAVMVAIWLAVMLLIRLVIVCPGFGVGSVLRVLAAMVVGSSVCRARRAGVRGDG